MNKKGLLLPIFILILSVSLVLINAQDYSDLTSTAGQISDSTLNIASNWQDIGNSIKASLLSSPFVSSADSFLRSISIVFVVLLGTDYSLSVAFFLTIMLWIFFFFVFKNILSMSLFSKGVSLVIALGLVIVLAQIGFLKLPVNLIIQTVFGEKPWWLKVIIGVAIFAVIAIIFILMKKFSVFFEAAKKKRKEEENRIKLETGAKLGEQFSRSVLQGEK